MGEQETWLWRKGVRRERRLHGLQTPLHPQQVIGWVVVVVIIAFMYGAVVPALHSSFVAPVAAASATLFLAHLFAHAVALLLDPAHPQVRERKEKKVVPEFDRSLHSHVIENGRCHLCNINITSPRTKHCSACNKCVDVFDHHCKWLNNCIGHRNYRVFLATVITAILSCLMVMGSCLAEIILYYFNRQYLAPWENGIPTVSPQEEGNEEEEATQLTCEAGSPYCHFSVFGARVYDGAFIGILSALFSLALVTGVLLIHLVAFHVYLLFLGLTTYEYIRGTNLSSGSTYGLRGEGAGDGPSCWNLARRSNSNQITPSSTTDTALLASPDLPSTTTTTPGTLSPRSNPSTPADDSRGLLGGRHLMAHHKQGSQQLSPRGDTFKKSFTSSVPTLPKISGASKVPIRTVSKLVATAGEKNGTNNISSSRSSSSEDDDVTVHLVSIPRPPRVSRRRLRSSVVPHLSPIKECDIASSSPPSVHTVAEVDEPPDDEDSSTPSRVYYNGSSSTPPYSPRTTVTTPPSILKNSSNHISPKPKRARNSSGRPGSPHLTFNSNVKSPTRDRSSSGSKSSPLVPSSYKKTHGVLSRTVHASSSPRKSSNSSSSKFVKSPSRPSSAPTAQIHIIKESPSFNGSNRVAIPTLRVKIPGKKEANGHIIATDITPAIVHSVDVDATNGGTLLSIVRSSSDGFLIKMGDVTHGGVYIGPHKTEQTFLSGRTVKGNNRAFVEHHM